MKKNFPFSFVFFCTAALLLMMAPHGAARAFERGIGNDGPPEFVILKKDAARDKILSVRESYQKIRDLAPAGNEKVTRTIDFDKNGNPVCDTYFAGAGNAGAGGGEKISRKIVFSYDSSENLIEETILDGGTSPSVRIRRRYSEPAARGELKEYSVYYHGGFPEQEGEKPFHEFKFIVQYGNDGRAAYAQDFKHSIFEAFSETAGAGGGKAREYRRTNFLWKKYGDVRRRDLLDSNGKLIKVSVRERDPLFIDSYFPNESCRDTTFEYDGDGRVVTQEVRLSPRFDVEEEKHMVYVWKYSPDGLPAEKSCREYEDEGTNEAVLKGIFKYQYKYGR